VAIFTGLSRSLPGDGIVDRLEYSNKDEDESQRKGMMYYAGVSKAIGSLR